MGIQVFHAGTALKEGGGVITSGGRVLTVTAVRPTLESALRSANEGVALISFPDAVTAETSATTPSLTSATAGV